MIGWAAPRQAPPCRVGRARQGARTPSRRERRRRAGLAQPSRIGCARSAARDAGNRSRRWKARTSPDAAGMGRSWRTLPRLDAERMRRACVRSGRTAGIHPAFDAQRRGSARPRGGGGQGLSVWVGSRFLRRRLDTAAQDVPSTPKPAWGRPTPPPVPGVSAAPPAGCRARPGSCRARQPPRHAAAWP